MTLPSSGRRENYYTSLAAAKARPLRHYKWVNHSMPMTPIKKTAMRCPLSIYIMAPLPGRLNTRLMQSACRTIISDWDRTETTRKTIIVIYYCCLCHYHSHYTIILLQLPTKSGRTIFITVIIMAIISNLIIRSIIVIIIIHIIITIIFIFISLVSLQYYYNTDLS